ncbi:MAG: hypothetical protein ACI9JL_003912 [Paracoccaceae bacterium]
MCCASVRRFQPVRHAAAAIVFAAISGLSGGAFATVNSVSVSPSAASIGTNGGSIALTWSVNRTQPVGAASTTTSPSATVVLNGQILLTTGSLSSRLSPVGAGVTETFTFSETISIPASVARRIARASGGGATISRTFTDSTGGAATQIVRLALNTGAAGAISVRRIDLAFDDGNRTRVIPRGNALRAIANLRFQGGGIFAGEWRVSVQDGVRGSGFERRLAIIRQPLSGAGNGATRLVSPPLPVDRPGLYQVRLVPDNPTTGLAVPAIRYYVTPSDLTRAPELKVSAPPAGSLLTADTRFAWTPVPRAAAYQIEIFETNGGPASSDPNARLLVGSDGLTPLTGRVVPGTASQASIADLTMRHIPPGNAYRWRIRALGPAGEVLAISTFRQLRR